MRKALRVWHPSCRVKQFSQVFVRIFCGPAAKNRAIRGSAIAPVPGGAPGTASRPSYPLRVPKSGIHAGFWNRSLPAANSIYPPMADSNGNSGIHAAGIRHQAFYGNFTANYWKARV
jgi:hypothetical protein